ncbi:uncharacterized protein LOC133806280 [Humulus lupulus]|uniref:uncharacterized protein LOC133806280 n=1 Tax=Humulus lupulus TaxID=3486 RepID=UPI002B40E293|nr:uncharacterized protein LOC133806280 [Humulus lupulus]
MNIGRDLRGLCASCPHHQISEQILIQYFYEGLQSLDRSMIDAASEGALVNKTPAAARSLISNMAANSQQFGIRQDPNPPPNSINEVRNSNENQLGHQLAQLTAVVQQHALGQQVRPCGICQVVGHAIDTCLTLFEGEIEGVNVVAAPQSTPVRPPSFSLQQQSHQKYAPRTMQAPQVAQPPSKKHSTEDLINAIATNMLQFQQTTQASTESLENQVGQLAASYNRLEAHLSNKLPSQLEKNPKENVSAITLESGIQYEPPTQPSSPAPILKKFKKEEVDKEILETFRKVEVNIPLLDAIKQVPCYAKFLKELCTNKKKLKDDEKISVGENVSAVLQKKLPQFLETRVIVQLVDRTNAYSLGVVEDVLVKVDGLVFATDFYILEMGDASIPNPTPVLFGRPFLMTTVY